MSIPELDPPLSLLGVKELPPEWREVASGELGRAVRLGPGRWIWKKSPDEIVAASVYATKIDWIVGNADGRGLVPKPYSVSELERARRVSDPPPAMRADLLFTAKENVARLEAEGLAFAEGKGCVRCAGAADTSIVLIDDSLHRCTWCGTFWRREYESELSPSGLWEQTTWSVCLAGDAIERVIAVNRPRSAAVVEPDAPSRAQTTVRAEPRRHPLPWRIPPSDVVPLGEALFVELGLTFDPKVDKTEEGIHRYVDASGRAIRWAHVVPDPFSWADVVGGEEHLLLAEIVVAEDVGVRFEIFASRLVGYTVYGDAEPAARVEAAMDRAVRSFPA